MAFLFKSVIICITYTEIINTVGHLFSSSIDLVILFPYAFKEINWYKQNSNQT